MRKLALALLLVASYAWAAGPFYAARLGNASASCLDATTNVCSLSRAASLATTGEIIYVAPDVYTGDEITSSGYLVFSAKAPSVICTGLAGSCVLRPTVSTGGVRYNTPPNGAVFSVSGITIDGVSGTAPNDCFWFQDSAGGTYTPTLTNNLCLNPVNYAHHLSATGINITINNDTLIANDTVTSRSFLFADRSGTTLQSGSVLVNGGSATIARHTITAGSGGIISLDAFAAGLTARVDQFVFSSTLSSALTGSGEHPGIQLLNFTNSSITRSVGSVQGNYGTRSTALFRINSCGNVGGQGCEGTETPVAIVNPYIKDVYGTIGSFTGYGAIIGQDTSTSADNQITGARIENAVIQCTTPETAAHGVMMGYLVGGDVLRSIVNRCGINFIAKKTSTSATRFIGNLSFNAVSQNFRAKGALVQWINNTAISSRGFGALYYADTETVSTTTSTVSLWNNIGYVNGGSPTYNVFVAPSNTLTIATTNDWFGLANWTNAASNYTSLATWNADAAVGTDLAVDPVFYGIPTASNPTAACLGSTSSITSAGTALNPSYMDVQGHVFANPPAIGAFTGCGDRPSVTRAAISR